MGYRMETADRRGKGTPYKIHHVLNCCWYFRAHCVVSRGWALFTSPETSKMRCHYQCNEKFNQISSKQNSITSVLMYAKAPRHPDVLASPQGRLFKSEVPCSRKSHLSQVACKECSNTEVFALLSFPHLSSFSLFL